MGFELVSFSGPDPLAHAAASEWLEKIAKAPEPYIVALSGGRIATNLFTAAAELARNNPAIRKVHFFWADERCVPPDHRDSNYRVAHQLLFEPLRVDPSRIHRIRGEAAPGSAAIAAKEELLRIAPKNRAGIPVFDLVFLGMGEDGHVASLFPDAPRQAAVYYPVIGPKPPPQRITVSYDVLAAAREVWVLASGPGKESALEASVRPDGPTPLGEVLRSRPNSRIFSDILLKSAASSALSEGSAA